jgi:hypothetical protein
MTALGVLLVLLGASLYFSATAPGQYQSSWMRQMWGGMGGMNGGGMMGDGGYGSPQPSFLWIVPVGLISIFAAGIIGVVFYMAFPEIRRSTGTDDAGRKEPVMTGSPDGTAYNQTSSSAKANPYELVSKTLNVEERKVLNVLIAHQGKYLQKHIRREAGLSRLKTHRIIARFVERGIVTAKQSGNTNEISLSNWLTDSKRENAA